MGTLTAFYVRVSSPEAREALLAEYPSAFTEPGTDFFAVDNPPCGFDPPEEELRDLSARLDTDVLWITFQSVVDAFEFHHWRKGVALRGLAFGCRAEERTWERVEGEPEPWEASAFEDLQAPMEPGQWDGMQSREVAREIAIHYRLPDWRWDWDPEWCREEAD